MITRKITRDHGGSCLISINEITIMNILTFLAVLFFLYIFVYPQSQIRAVKRKRLAHINNMERQWGTRVLTMIHRKEAISMFGVPIYQFIDIEDAEQILRGIRKAGDRPIDLILHTPGGHMHASIQIARALKDHKGHTRVMIPHYSMSGGTIIALAADEIIMDSEAAIGPIDPQVGDLIRGTFPAPSWIYAASQKGTEADDITFVMSDISQKAIKLTRDVALELLEGSIEDEDKLKNIVNKLVSGEMVHIAPISAAEAIELGLPVSTNLPEEVHDLMELYKSAKTTVEYLE